jgi:peptidoglycan hydrolase CwlO-like protein
LQTADRINLTLQPTLKIFTDSLSTATRQLEAVRSQVERQSNTQDNQGLLLAKLEKDVHYLTIQANGLEPRLVAEKNEYLQRMSAIQKVSANDQYAGSAKTKS